MDCVVGRVFFAGDNKAGGERHGEYWKRVLVLLGGVSLSLVFTFLAAIAAKAQQNAAIMAIMGFPLIIPQLIMLMKISATTFTEIGNIDLIPLLLLIAFDLLVILLSIILFPFLWKD